MQHMTDERCLASVQWQEKEVLLLSNWQPRLPLREAVLNFTYKIHIKFVLS